MDISSLKESIKQAFIDAGWQLPDAKVYWAKHGDNVYIVNGHDSIKRVDLQTLLTGQEWYDRFIEELNKDMLANQPNRIIDDPVRIIEATKKAAGLE